MTTKNNIIRILNSFDGDIKNKKSYYEALELILSLMAEDDGPYFSKTPYKKFYDWPKLRITIEFGPKKDARRTIWE